MDENTSNHVKIKSDDGKFEYTQYEGEDGIVYAKAVGHQDVGSANKIAELSKEVHRRLGRKFSWALDVSDLEKVEPEARKVMSDNTLAKDSVVENMAIIGANFFIRNLMNMYAKVSKVPVRVFKTKEEAVSWLKEGSEK